MVNTRGLHYFMYSCLIFCNKIGFGDSFFFNVQDIKQNLRNKTLVFFMGNTSLLFNLCMENSIIINMKQFT